MKVLSASSYYFSCPFYSPCPRSLNLLQVYAQALAAPPTVYLIKNHSHCCPPPQAVYLIGHLFPWTPAVILLARSTQSFSLSSKCRTVNEEVEEEEEEEEVNISFNFV